MRRLCRRNTRPHAEPGPGCCEARRKDGSGSQRRTGSGRKKGAPDHARTSEKVLRFLVCPQASASGKRPGSVEQGPRTTAKLASPRALVWSVRITTPLALSMDSRLEAEIETRDIGWESSRSIAPARARSYSDHPRLGKPLFIVSDSASGMREVSRRGFNRSTRGRIRTQ